MVRYRKGPWRFRGFFIRNICFKYHKVWAIVCTKIIWNFRTLRIPDCQCMLKFQKGLTFHYWRCATNKCGLKLSSQKIQKNSLGSGPVRRRHCDIAFDSRRYLWKKNGTGGWCRYGTCVGLGSWVSVLLRNFVLSKLHETSRKLQWMFPNFPHYETS